MLETIAVILIVLWILGLVSSYTWAESTFLGRGGRRIWCVSSRSKTLGDRTVLRDGFPQEKTR